MKKKTAERFYGRRGRGFADEGVGSLQHELHAARLRELKKGPPRDNAKGGTWPLESLRRWDEIARRGAARGSGFSLSPAELMAIEVVQVARDAGWRWR